MRASHSSAAIVRGAPSPSSPVGSSALIPAFEDKGDSPRVLQSVRCTRTTGRLRRSRRATSSLPAMSELTAADSLSLRWMSASAYEAVRGQQDYDANHVRVRGEFEVVTSDHACARNRKYLQGNSSQFTRGRALPSGIGTGGRAKQAPCCSRTSSSSIGLQ